MYSEDEPLAIGRTKVAIAGCGAVGSALAFGLAQSHVCDDIMLIDINKRKAWADVCDIRHSIAFAPYKMNVIDGDYSMCGDVDVVVLALSSAYHGTSREDMIGSTGTVISTVVPEIMHSGFNGTFVVITNPVDTVTYMVKKLSGLSDSKVIGTGTSLDSARLRYCIAERLLADVRDVDAFFFGEHGPSQFVPWSCVRVGGRDITKMLAKDDLALIERTALDLKQRVTGIKGAAVFGIASVALQIVRAVLHDENTEMPISATLNGEYGINDISLGVPARIGHGGITSVTEYELNADEKIKMLSTAAEVRRSIEKIRHLVPNI